MVSQNAVIAAFVSTALISVAPNVLLVLFPQYASGEGLESASALLSYGQAIAAGGLLGDVFLHTIPHSMAHDAEIMGLYILVGFCIFFIIDVLVRSSSEGHSHSHSHSHQSSNNNDNDNPHDHQKHQVTATNTSAIILNLLGDSLHNFTDGIAIGVSFASSSTSNNSDSGNMSISQLLASRGGIATLSILMHEVPHELGDFAVLVKNGMSKRQAILAQFGTALAAMVGTLLGLRLHEFAGDKLIYITSGGFLYLATVTIMPELLQEEGTSQSSTVRFRILQLLCFAAGIGLMYLVTLLEAASGECAGHSHSHAHHQHEYDHHVHGHDHQQRYHEHDIGHGIGQQHEHDQKHVHEEF